MYRDWLQSRVNSSHVCILTIESFKSPREVWIENALIHINFLLKDLFNIESFLKKSSLEHEKKLSTA